MAIREGKPFLKWAGGKSQLLSRFETRFPDVLKKGLVNTYVEPFVGGGALYFYINSVYDCDECHIFDANEELILAYSVIKNDVDELVAYLKDLEKDYLKLDEEGRKACYYKIREEFNRNVGSIQLNNYNNSGIERASQLIFLNRTCFNGLFRVNRKGEFNVPFGRYKNPTIANEALLELDSKLLENTEIHHGDFSDSGKYINSDSFVYLDPPYRPLNRTSSFTNYSKDRFGDEEQIRLSEFYREINRRDARIMLSNSDPKNNDPEDDFFDNLYAGYTIDRVPARRMINSNGDKRGGVNELIITNYSISGI